MTTLAETLGPRMEPPDEAAHCCAEELCLITEDMRIARRLLDAIVDSLDKPLDMLDRKPAARALFDRLVRARNDIDDTVHELSSVDTCDYEGICKRCEGD